MWGSQHHPQSSQYNPSHSQTQPTSQFGGTQPAYNPYSAYSYNGQQPATAPGSAPAPTPTTAAGQAAQQSYGRQHVYDQRQGHGGGVYGFPQRESNERMHHQYETHRVPTGMAQSNVNTASAAAAAAASQTPQKTYQPQPTAQPPTQPTQHQFSHPQPHQQPHPQPQNPAASPAPTTTHSETDDHRSGALSPVPKISMISKIVNDINPIRVKYETLAYSQLTDNEKENAEITKHRKAYTELLTQKVVGLDGVEAEGLESVRQARKEAVVKLEALLSQLDTFVKRETELREIMRSGPV